jgi:CheY-like chemotaxis protein
MCLISNAIKYSCGGSVVVCCYLMEGPAKISSPSINTSSDIDDRTALPIIKTPSNVGMGQYLVVEVEDSGIGISLDKRHTLFSPFQRAQRMATGGTGLGLYSLRKRIESLGGECGIKDRYDGKQGTVVWFSFPYRPDPTGSCPISARSCSISAESSVDGHYESAEENNLSVLRRKAKLIGEAANRINRSPIDRIRYPTHSHSKHGSGSKTPKSQNLSPNPNSNALSPALVLTPILSPVSRASSHLNGNSKSQFEISAISNLRAPRILIVDDSMSILKMCRRAMERAGYAVTVAENGFLALDILILKHREFDVMLTDLQMPVMVNIT